MSKQVLYNGKQYEYLGYVIDKEDCTNIYYLIQDDIDGMSYVDHTKKGFVESLSDSWNTYIFEDRIDLNAKFTWVHESEFKFINNNLMETE